MNSKSISLTLVVTVVFVFALLIVGCGSSGDKKAGSPDQEVVLNDDSENDIIETTQPAIDNKINSESPENTEEENTVEDEKSANKQEPATSVLKNTSTPKTPTQSAGSNKATPEPKAQTPPVDLPKSDPASPVKTDIQEEEIEVVVPSETKPNPEPVFEEVEDEVIPPPVIEEPVEVIVPAPVIEQPKSELPSSSNWAVPAKDNNKVNPIKADSESLSIGKTLYKKHCASCHGKTGLGDGPKASQFEASCGDFTLPVFQNQTDGSLFYKTREGRDDMPSYKKKIPDEEDHWHIVNYMRSFK